MWKSLETIYLSFRSTQMFDYVCTDVLSSISRSNVLKRKWKQSLKSLKQNSMQVFWIKTRVRQKEFSPSPTYTLPFARVSRVNVERLLYSLLKREKSVQRTKET